MLKMNKLLLLPFLCSFFTACNKEKPIEPIVDFTANIYGEGLIFKEGESLPIKTGEDFTCTFALDHDYLAEKIKKEYGEDFPVEDFYALPAKESVHVKIGTEDLKSDSYSYNENTGAFSIAGNLITNDLYIVGKLTELNPLVQNVEIIYYAGNEDYKHFDGDEKIIFQSVKYGTTYKELDPPRPVDFDNPEGGGGYYTFSCWKDINGEKYQDDYSFKEPVEILIADYDFVPAPYSVTADCIDCTFYGDDEAKNLTEYRCVFSPKLSAEKNYILTDESLIELSIGGQPIYSGYRFERLDNLLDYQLIIPAEYVTGNIHIQVKAEENVLTGMFYEYNQTMKGYNVTDYYLDLIAEIKSPLESISIPTSYDDSIHGGAYVVKINDNAFHWLDIGLFSDHPIHIDLPLHLEEIGANAFADFYLSPVDSEISPVSIVIPKTVKAIGAYAFGAYNYTADNACIYVPYRSQDEIESDFPLIDEKWNYVKGTNSNEDVAIPVEYRGDADDLDISIDLETQKYAITGLHSDDNEKESLVLPNVYFDYSQAGSPYAYPALPVLSISDNAFKDNKVISNVTLPNALEIIGQEAFSGCTALGASKTTPFIIPDTVNTIKTGAFADWSESQYIQIDSSCVHDNVTTWGWELVDAGSDEYTSLANTKAKIIVKEQKTC